MSQKKSFFFPFCGVMAAGFLLLTIWSLASGEEAVSKTLDENAIHREVFDNPHATFELKEGQVCELEVEGITLSNSWMWIKTLILDEDNRPVHEYQFDLSYYHGADWSEGERDDSQVFYLPPGKYKLLVYGEDAQRPDAWTRPSHERVKVTVSKGVVLTRYSFAGLLVFGLGFGLMLWNRQSKHDDFSY